jgi:methyl-coenzyme M reductase subunit D
MDIEIFPHRLLSADTTEKLLNNLEEIEDNPDRRVITILGEEVDLQVKTGRVLMEIEDEAVIEQVKIICEDHLPFGYNIHVGTFIRKQKTVTDDMKYGEAADEIPEEMFGLTDQNAQLSERATIIKKKD